ncbi:MAG: IS66 family insertion sequence element accessory protein TnpB [Anaeromyxobacter sp.]
MIPAGVRIFAATAPVDMRRGFVGLAEAAREGLGHDLGGGALFVFFNKRRDKLKLLWHDGPAGACSTRRSTAASSGSPTPHRTKRRSPSTVASSLPSSRCCLPRSLTAGTSRSVTGLM